MTRVCAVEDVPPGEGRAVALGERRVALFNASGGWYALDALCPHRGGPLADGILADRAVICPLHERRFDLDSGASLDGEEGVACYRVELRGGSVFVGPR